MPLDARSKQGSAARAIAKPASAALICALFAGLSLLAVPSPVSAQPVGWDGGLMGSLASHVGLLVLLGGLVIVASLVNRFARGKRRNIRRAVIPLLLYVVALGASAALSRIGFDAAAQGVRAVSELLAVITAANLVAIVLFDLFLPAIGVEVSTLVTDVALGIAYVVAIIAGMRRYGVDLSGIIATSAVVTAILALSLQATLGNIVGGVALQLDHSINVGDWIQLENGRQGRVREIRWRHTVIETRDWDTLIVPNAVLLAATIMILGKRDGEPLQRRMSLFFNVDFRYSPADVISVVEDALRGARIEGVAESPSPSCVCLDFAKDGRDSFAHYSLRYWLTELSRDDVVSSSVRARLFSALKRASIPLAVPAAQLFVEQDDPERRERKHKRELDRRVGALRAIEFLKPLTSEELADVAGNLRYAMFAAGEVIMKQGNVAHSLYVLMDGVVEVRVAVPGAPDRLVTTMKAPDVFGEMGLMTGEPRPTTVVAVTEVECYRLDKEVFHKILDARPEVAAEMSALLAERRLALETATFGVDATARKTRLDLEQNRLLSTIRGFFGLGRDERGEG